MLRKDIRKVSPAAAGTADPVEIARFDALAEEWWKPDGAFRVIHAFNRVRVAHISERLPALLQRDPRAVQPLGGLNIIDVGCGAGLVTEPISALGATVLGIDASARNVMIAGRHARSSGASVRYFHALPEDCADLAGTFDVAMSLEVVEHVADLPAFLEALARLVAPRGIVLIGTLNRTVRSFVKAIIGAEYVLGWLPRGTHAPQTDYWQWNKPGPGGILAYKNHVPWEIVDIFEKHGFIWGGKWYNYDTMHFEYRPEIIAAGK